MSQLHYKRSKARLSMGDLEKTKRQSLKLAEHLQAIGEATGDERYKSQAERVRYCSTFWQGYFCKECGKYHYMHTTGCHHRLCPICAVRQARVVAVQAMEAIQFISDHEEKPLRLSLLTLTQKNVKGSELNREVSSLLEAWERMRHIREFERGVKGWARTIEIVPALNDPGSFHPHIHCILIHSDETSLCSAREWWAKMWKRSMELDYEPIVDIRPVENTEGAVYEVSKYVSKLSRVYDGSEWERFNVKHMTDAIYNRRLRSYGGIWAKARKRLNMARVEQMNDDAISEYGDMLDSKCDECGKDLAFVSLRWAGLKFVTMPEDLVIIPPLISDLSST